EKKPVIKKQMGMLAAKREKKPLLYQRSFLSSTYHSISTHKLTKELYSASLDSVLRHEKGREIIIREIVSGSTLESNPKRRTQLMSAIGDFLMENCRIPYSPTYTEKAAFVSNLLAQHRQFHPFYLCQSGSTLSKHISYIRGVVTLPINKRPYTKSKVVLSLTFSYFPFSNARNYDYLFQKGGRKVNEYL
ncbi:hypothetical protein PFISCL1PPCAC_11000, partial [Pristionchus fissidentatus]